LGSIPNFQRNRNKCILVYWLRQGKILSQHATGLLGLYPNLTLLSEIATRIVSEGQGIALVAHWQVTVPIHVIYLTVGQTELE
jgi:hypothetical protein